MDHEILAFMIFRNRYGVACDPEDHPVLWEACLNLASEMDEVDEGGEG